MDISKLSKAKVLAALFNRARPLGIGWLHYDPHHIMDEKEAEALLEKYNYFDYLEGRVLKVNFSGDKIDTSLYNRDNGQGAAEAVISELKNTEDHPN